jgi:succinate dehydrogenase / fumarate reductase cytochrome b subunit
MSAMTAGILSLHRTTIGKKVIMAVTGLVWIGFVVGHLYGNLKVFLGPDYFNEYAHGLRIIGAPLFGEGHLLFIARFGLIATLVLHIWAATTLTLRARAARPTRYTLRETVQASLASRTMRWGGVMILFFILYHLAHFTWGIPGIHNEFDRANPYANLVIGFRSVPVVLFYLLGLTALGFHLYHGTWSMFQTLGLNNKDYTLILRGAALGLAVIVPIGFALIPLAALFGILTV